MVCMQLRLRTLVDAVVVKCACCCSKALLRVTHALGIRLPPSSPVSPALGTLLATPCPLPSPSFAAILLLFYSAPLSTILEVVRTRSSATLNLPLSVMNVVNGSLWLVYGLAISDYFIAVPNGVGAGLGVVYCALIFTFPRKLAK